MRDQLLGYVLGALEASEHERVEQLLGSDARLREEMELAHKALTPLKCDQDHLEPPPGLAAMTCRKVASVRVERVHPTQRRVTLSAEGAVRPRRSLFGWSLVDVAVAAGILIAAGMLILPALNHSRFNAQVARCQNNLATIGRALGDYSTKDPQGNYPVIPVSGHLSAAGLYAPKLIHSGHIAQEKANVFRCSLDGTCKQPDIVPIPTMTELEGASKDQARKLLRHTGGSYGYTLGYMDSDGVYHPTQRRGRTNFPIMSDAPCPKLGYGQSSNHGGYGQNVLYDDGHVRYTTTSHQIDGTTDPDFFHNDAGEVAAGTHVNDAVIGCSSARPTASKTAEDKITDESAE